MIKELYKSPDEQYKILISELEKIVRQWTQLSESEVTDEGLYESDVRNQEKEAVSNLINFLKNNPDFAETNKQELHFIGEEYLSIGDCSDLKKELSKLIGLKYWDPFSGEAPEKGAIGPSGALRQVQKEVGKFVDEDDEKKKKNSN